MEKTNKSEIISKKILVLGDVMIDTYVFGRINRISPEAPVPVLEYSRTKKTLGGAANVAVNLVAANQRVSLISVAGEDENAFVLSDLLRKENIHEYIVKSKHRVTTEKTRFLAENNQQVLRLDSESVEELSEDEFESVRVFLDKIILNHDLIVLSDYMKGFLTEKLIKLVVEKASERNIPIIVDVKDKNFKKYSNTYLIKPNLKELHSLTGMPVSNDEEIYRASECLRKECNCNYVLTTMGAKGMLLVGKEIKKTVPAVGKEVFDVCGAGDTTIAYLAACLANGMEITESVRIASIAAGIQVSKIGTSSVFLKEIYDILNDKKKSNKEISKDELSKFRTNNANKKIVFTNGCFDILHIGHIRYLQEASKRGDILIVGVNSDSSVRRIKGESRPINTESDRMEMLKSFDFIDYVVIFDEDTPYNIIMDLKPDVLVKGADYKGKEVIGANEVLSWGGRVELISFVEGKSTTNVINKIKEQN